MRFRSRAACVLLALSAPGGCAVGPDFHRPAGVAPAGYLPDAGKTPQRLGDQEIAAGTSPATEWWRDFGSEELNALVAKALRRNSDLAAAREALKAARQTYLASLGALAPEVDASFGSSRNKSSEYLSPPLNSQSFYYSLQTAQLQISYALDLFGGVRRQIEGEKAAAEVQKFQSEGVYLTLVSNLVVAAIQEAALAEEVRAEQTLIRTQRDALGIMRAQAKAGQIGQGDLLVQEAALAQAEAALPPLEKQAAVQRDLLAYLTGEAPEKAPRGVALDAVRLPARLPLSLPAEVVDKRPDIRVAEANLHVASAAVGVAVAARLPAVTLTADGGGQAATWGQVFTTANSFWSYGASLAQPVFQGGTLLRKQKAAEHQLRQARELYRSAVLGAFQNIADALQALSVDARAEEIAASAERTARTSYEIARRQLAAGGVDGLVLLTAEEALRGAEVNRIQARAARLIDSAALYQALGGAPPDAGLGGDGRADPPAGP